MVGQTTSYDESSPLDLYLALDEDGAASGTLYEDAGEGHAYLEDQFRLIRLRAETRDGRVVVTLERQAGALELPTRVVRAHLYSAAGVVSAEGMNDRVEFGLSAP